MYQTVIGPLMVTVGQKPQMIRILSEGGTLLANQSSNVGSTRQNIEEYVPVSEVWKDIAGYLLVA